MSSNNESTATRECNGCTGTGKIWQWGEQENCGFCNGSGKLPAAGTGAPDLEWFDVRIIRQQSITSLFSVGHER